MKNDEVKGGIKVFNEKEKKYIDGGNKRLGFKKGKTIGCVVVNGKRKTWKNESFEGFEKR